MSSSREDAIDRLRKWSAAKAHIKASFVGNGLTFNMIGRILLDEKESRVWMVRGNDESPLVVLSLSLLVAVPCESFEPLLDAPDDRKFSMDFLAAEAFKLPYGYLDFRELATEEDS